MIFVIRGTNPNANSRVNFSAIFIWSIAIRCRSDVWRDVATEAQGGLHFHSSVQLIRRRDIARYSGSTTARLCVNFNAIFIGNWRCRVAMQHSESNTAAHLCVNFNATRCSGTCCGNAQISARFLFSDIVHNVRSDESHDLIWRYGWYSGKTTRQAAIFIR